MIRHHRRKRRISTHWMVTACAIVVLNFWCLVVFFLRPSFSHPSKRRPIVHTVLSSQAALYDIQDPFCVDWNINVDGWWSNHPDFELYSMNATHQCFGPILDLSKRQLWKILYAIQFPNQDGCSKVQSKFMTGSGWGVDTSHVLDGLKWAVHSQTPVQIIAPTPWQYASNLYGPATCPSEDWNCYFLPLTNCSNRFQPQRPRRPSIRYYNPWRGFDPVHLEFATRGQTWLRQRVAERVESVQLPTSKPCAVLHVRRADVILHENQSRRYHAISAYLSKLPQHIRNLLLLTDDANAIVEAATLHKQHYTWYYLDRPRHRGPEGGWEHQVPSGSPASEVVSIFAALELAKRCTVLVHSKSNLADYIYSVMEDEHRQAMVRIDLDEDVPHNYVHRSQNADSVKVSTRFESMANPTLN